MKSQLYCHQWDLKMVLVSGEMKTPAFPSCIHRHMHMYTSVSHGSVGLWGEESPNYK